MAASQKDEKQLLFRIISLCNTAEEQGLDPFEVEVQQALKQVREYLKKCDSFEEFCLDAEAVNSLTKVIKLQGDWLKYRTSRRYVDPLLVEFKLGQLAPEALVECLSRCWHPILELNQLSWERLKQGVDYWNKLLKWSEREERLQRASAGLLQLTEEDLKRMGLVSEKEFSYLLKDLWNELKEKASKDGKLRYLSFICSRTFEETVRRAYLTSFLVSYGYARIEPKPLEEEVFLMPNESPGVAQDKRRTVSVPFSFTFKDWELEIARAIHG